jgi:uncharacterized Zn finger protein
MTDPSAAVCDRCGATPGDDAVTTSRPDDPLVVRECGRCGSVIDVGGHAW